MLHFCYLEGNIRILDCSRRVINTVSLARFFALLALY